MKHFFHVYDENKCRHGLLKGLFSEYSKKDRNEQLKILYDAADIIRDIRFEKENVELNEILELYIRKKDLQVAEESLEATEISRERSKFYRVNALKVLWRSTEQEYQIFEKDPYKDIIGEKEFQVSITRILYHLTRGNICMRISQCYFENYDLEQSEFWEDRAMEIFWHGKQAAYLLRESQEGKNKFMVDLYLRLIRLNLAKYYRDYARKNRRSDLDAAFFEFDCSRMRTEINIRNAPEEWKRQYALIWMDSVFNLIYYYRRRYQAESAQKEILRFYHCLHDQLKDETGLSDDFTQLVKQAEILMPDDKTHNGPEGFISCLPDLENTTVSICKYLDSYDRKRYFLLILLESGRILRALHFMENYALSVSIAIIADKWSYYMDRRLSWDSGSDDRYEPDHNLDALIIFSNALRKYMKFGDFEKCSIEKALTVMVNGQEHTFRIRNSNQKAQCSDQFSDFIDKLMEFASRGHQRSKEEIIKWYCFYLQNKVKLYEFRDVIGDFEKIKIFFGEEDQNLQLRFLKGLVSVRAGLFPEAIDIFKKLTSQEVKATQYIRFATIGLKARYLLANCYMSLAEYTKAEKILKSLQSTLANARESRENNSILGSTDAETDARIEVDLAYCYMQKGDYDKGISIYRSLYGDGGNAEEAEFGLLDVKNQRRIMGLNNYAACCILSADEPEQQEQRNADGTPEKKLLTAKKIFEYLDAWVPKIQKKNGSHYITNDPETNLLKGYYILSTGRDPKDSPVSTQQLAEYRNSRKTRDSSVRAYACVKAHTYFRRACQADESFSARYSLMDDQGFFDKGIYRNEVERISVYLINLVKINQWYAAGMFCLEDDICLTETEKDYLENSEWELKRVLLCFPKAYQISLKAAIALAEWILDQEAKNDRGITVQLFRSFSYITIYEERGAKVFNNLKENQAFRLFTADQRGKLLALLLSMYQPIKTVKEECCFTYTDMKNVKQLVHYTTMKTLKGMLTAENPRFRINNCGYMNDVFEGRVFLQLIEKIAEKEESFISKYFPQLRRSDEDRIPSGSNVYLGSLSVQKDSFNMWSVYANNETGCNLEFNKDFFDIKGKPYYPRALRDYLISKYSDQDYPLYIVQYISKEFDRMNEKWKNMQNETGNEQGTDQFEDQGRKQTFGTRAISYEALIPLLKQVYIKWSKLDTYISKSSFSPALRDAIYAFTADRINEIRFLFKDENYEFEGEVRVIYTDYTDGKEAKTDGNLKIPRVYVDLNRELEGLIVTMGSRIEDVKVDQYVTWLKHTKRVDKVGLAERNRI